MTTIALLFVAASQTFSLPPGLLSALCYVESHHDTKAMNPHDGGSESVGVCQIKESTARLVGFRGTREQLKDPWMNIYYSGAYLQSKLIHYHGDLVKGVAAYNAGTCRMSKRNCSVPANLKYVNKVLKALEEGR